MPMTANHLGQTYERQDEHTVVANRLLVSACRQRHRLDGMVEHMGQPCVRVMTRNRWSAPLHHLLAEVSAEAPNCMNVSATPKQGRDLDPHGCEAHQTGHTIGLELHE